MEKNNVTDEKLLDYIDGILSKEEATRIEQILSQNNVVNRRYVELSSINTVLSREMEVKKTSVNFSNHVMMSLNNARKPIGRGGLIILVSTVITVLLASYFMVGGLIDLSAIQQVDLISNVSDQLPQAINLKTVNSILLFMLTILSLLVFDKTVLRPMFKKRKYNY